MIEVARATRNQLGMALLTYSYTLVPRPHPLRSCTPSRDSVELNVLSHMNAELAQPRYRSNVTRRDWGLGMRLVYLIV